MGVYQQEVNMSPLTQADNKKALCARLARVEGQVRGVQKLVQSDADCHAIAQQLSAARKALDKSFYTMIACMIEQGDHDAATIAQTLAKFA
jgi:CsoR family transcriptional regulator, copper-sensing transcriptional repressor